MTSITKAEGVKQDQKGSDFYIGEIDLPQLQEGDVLIEVWAAPINPCDEFFLKGLYPEPRKFPGHAGIEGSGKVIQVQGESAKHLQGKKVAFTPKHNEITGSYANYAISTVDQAFVLPDDTDLDIGACTYINPFTCVYIYEAAMEHKPKAVLNDVAQSSLGKQIYRYFTSKGIEVINVVRKSEQAEDFKNEGAKYILNSSEEGYWDQFKQLCAKLEVNVVLDSIGGDYLAKLLDYVPNHTHVIFYGNLSRQQEIPLNSFNMLFSDVHVHPLWLVLEQQKASKEKSQRVASECTKLVQNELKTRIAKKFHPKDLKKALEYYDQNRSQGKVLITYKQSE